LPPQFFTFDVLQAYDAALFGFVGVFRELKINAFPPHIAGPVDFSIHLFFGEEYKNVCEY